MNAKPNIDIYETLYQMPSRDPVTLVWNASFFIYIIDNVPEQVAIVENRSVRNRTRLVDIDYCTDHLSESRCQDFRY